MPQAEGHARNCMDTEPRQISATYPGSRTVLVMRIVHWRRPLALASPSKAFAMTRATVSRSQADPVFFLITKWVRALCQNGLPYCATRFAALTKSCQLALLADIPKRHTSTVSPFSPVRGVFLPLRHLILST